MKRALISVFDKTGIEVLAKGFTEVGVEIISTGGTRKYLTDCGIPTIGIEEVTNFPEMLDGRVKTLHPKIHGGLLGRRDLMSHVKAVEEHEIQWIDYVVVNLYPFKETIAKVETSLAEAVEQIDIGGPSMLRSGAKNFASVTVIVDPADYQQVLDEVKTNNQTTMMMRERLAAKVFCHTAAYDALIANYLMAELGESYPEKLTLTYEKKQGLRYGENNHQQASFYADVQSIPYSIAEAKQLHGKELSYNNIHDTDAALRIINEYHEPTVVAVKHRNPCGVGSGKTILEAYTYAYNADTTSIFGGIIALNREVDVSTAKKMSELFLEIIIAPNFTKEALDILRKKKNIRLMTTVFPEAAGAVKLELTSVMGGLLVQESDTIKEQVENWEVVTDIVPSPEEIKALEFAWRVVKHVKSNAIVVAKENQTLGIGAGQMNRIGSVKIAIDQARSIVDSLRGAVMASDAFFPMDDCVSYAAEHGIHAIIQPGGSIKDQQSIDKANELGIAMIFTGVRHFKH